MVGPPQLHVNSQLRHLVYYNLDNGNLKNAIFLAERLKSCDSRSPESTHLLALCYLRSGQYRHAYDQTKTLGFIAKVPYFPCAYIFAEAARLCGRPLEGIQALERCKNAWRTKNHWGKHSSSLRVALPDAATVCCLLGQLYRDHGNTKESIENFAESLRLNPFMWDAFEALCAAGANIRVSQVFKLSPELRSLLPAPRLSEKSVNTAAVAVHEDPRNGSPNPPSRATSVPLDDDPFVSGPSTRSANNPALRLFQTRGKDSTASKVGSVRSDDNLIDLEMVPEAEYEPASVEDDIENQPMQADEVPKAPGRRTRTRLAFGLPETSHLPAKPKPMPNLRSRAASEDDRPPPPERPISQSQPERKRTNAGAPASTQQPQSSDPTAAPQRRSTRIIERGGPLASKLSSLGSTFGIRDNRDRRKVPAVGLKTRANGVPPGPNSANSVTTTLENMDLDVENAIPTGVTETLTNQPMRGTEQTKHEEALIWLLSLVEVFAQGHFALSQYQCEYAVKAFKSLPAIHQETTYVLLQTAKAQFELSHYTEAEKLFARLRKLAPSQTEGMEYYSTVLWQQKKDVELAFLSHELSELDRLSPQVWCTMGNSFSLQGDRDNALNCFHRATQLDPKFAYAWTLRGHEYCLTEEFDKAAVAYRTAVGVAPRHYNAWYGLGKVNTRMGKYEAAAHDHKIAAAINRNNAVLLCAVGAACNKTKHFRDALQHYTKACELDPKSGLSHFKRAQLLLQTNRMDEALQTLILLRDLTPDEANVHYLLGKVFKAKGEKSLAIQHFTRALSLDPKASGLIKESIEQLEEDFGGDTNMDQ